ncbi:MAG: efflux RND transporter permease subunit, partial [Symploca sp. SIO2B6]|nr:efflux RND transporter permease subunit [Symploca sp. SIO2B6]
NHVTHTRSSLGRTVPQLKLTVDEEKARLLGLDKGTIAQQLDATLEGIEGGSILESTEELPVRVRLSNADRGNLAQVESINLLPPGPPVSGPSISNLSGGNGNGNGMDWIPLSSVATVTLEPEQARITRFNGQRVNTIQGFVEAGTLPDTVLGQLNQQLEDIQFPSGYSLSQGGEAEERADALGGLVSTVGLITVLMMATLVLSLKSFRLSGLIWAVAIASFGLGIFAITLFGYPFGFNPIIGTVGLIGVAINDSIVVLAALDENPHARMGDRHAVQTVVMKSTRHVLTTTFTTMIGFVPLLLDGGEFWPPLAVAIAGGVGGATLLALYFIPSAYILLKRRNSYHLELAAKPQLVPH